MRRHETPIAIANALAKHSPRKLERILDPAVGRGVLLKPFIERFGAELEAVAVDSDSRPLKRLQSKLGSASGDQLKIVHADFLDWACRYATRGGELFDCVVMNPPFIGRRDKWRSLVGVKRLIGLNTVSDLGPVEAGFVLGAIALLKPGGRLLAVLPASLMTSPSCAWVREVMVNTGAIRRVHELPHFAFADIEARIYLVVYEKGCRQKETLLLNHDLDLPERMLISPEVVNRADRLDFGYHNAVSRFDVLKRRASLDWTRLSDLAVVLRGSEKTPLTGRSVIHTNSYVDGFWVMPAKARVSAASSKFTQIQVGDILVRRVSRNCTRSFGVSVGVNGAKASDCVLVVRPSYRINSAKLLFAIRCLMALDFGPGLLEKGTGASYIGQRELEILEVPYGLWKECRISFTRYLRALRKHSFAEMQAVETLVASWLDGTRAIR